MIARGEKGEIAPDGIGIGAVAASGKVEVAALALALAGGGGGGELLPAPRHVVADEDEGDVCAALGEVVSEGGHGVEIVMAVDRYHAHLKRRRVYSSHTKLSPLVRYDPRMVRSGK